MATPTTESQAAVQAEAPAGPPRLAELRELAKTDPARAQRETWEWIGELGKRARSDREGAEAELNELFRAGTPPRGLDEETEGILVTPLIQPFADRLLWGLTSAWMPWLGKRFDAAAGRGDNILTGSARWPAKLIWPLYGTKGIAKGRAAFDFETRVEPGKADPDTDVLVIDYSVVDSNPRLIIRSIRDELVELVPDTYLGKILWAREDWPCIGFFALRQPA